MTKPVLENVSRGREGVAGEVQVCRSFWMRLKGLLGTKTLAPHTACWIEPCNSIHTFGMAYSIDAYFLDRKGCVIGMEKDLKPNRLSRIYSGARTVVEMASGFPRPITLGDQLILKMSEKP